MVDVSTICPGCGKPILDHQGCVVWKGRHYHPAHAPPPEARAVLRALRLIEERARKNYREGLDGITVSDIEWAIQELEKG